MNIRFYVDHHVRRAITEGLRDRGVNVLTAQEDQTNRWDDELLLNRATELRRTLFTQDDDFLAIAQNWLRNGRPFAGIVYAHQQRIGVAKAIEDLELISRVLEPHEMLNQVAYLPL